MTRFAKALPRLREQVEADLAATDELTRERVLACAVRLLDRGFFRIGTEEYTVTNESFGLATMRKRARAASRTARWSSTTPPRAASAASRPSSTRSRRTSCARSSAAAAAAPELLAYKHGRQLASTCARDDINAYLKADDRRRLLGQGLPDLERDGDRRARAGRLRPGARLQDLTQARDHARDQGDRRTTWATRPPSAARPTSTRASSTPTAAGSCSTSKVIADALDAEPGDLPTHHPRIERAVLDLIDEREHAPGVETIAA